MRSFVEQNFRSTYYVPGTVRTMAWCGASSNSFIHLFFIHSLLLCSLISQTGVLHACARLCWAGDAVMKGTPHIPQKASSQPSTALCFSGPNKWLCSTPTPALSPPPWSQQAPQRGPVPWEGFLFVVEQPLALPWTLCDPQPKLGLGCKRPTEWGQSLSWEAPADSVRAWAVAGIPGEPGDRPSQGVWSEGMSVPDIGRG